MTLHKWKENILTLGADGEFVEITFPEITSCIPVFSEDQRYMAVGAFRNVYVYDCHLGIMATHASTGKECVRSLRFDCRNRLYYADKNSLMRWDFKAQETACLLSLPRAVHGPEYLGISPDNKYLSFCRYRTDDDRLFLLNMETGECTDMKLSVFQYIWIDETHIAWSKSGGLKIMDVVTGKHTTIVRDFRSVLAKCNETDRERLAQFASSEIPDSDIQLLGLYEGRLFFSLWVYRFSPESIHHKGIWSVNADGSRPMFVYPMPDRFMKGISRCFLEDGSLYADDKDGAFIFDGSVTREFARDWRPVVCFGQVNRI